MSASVLHAAAARDAVMKRFKGALFSDDLRREVDKAIRAVTPFWEAAPYPGENEGERREFLKGKWPIRPVLCTCGRRLEVLPADRYGDIVD